MINFWLDLPVFWMVVAASATFGLTAVILSWLCHHSPAAQRIQGWKGLVAPFFTVVSLLFGLFLAFLAADVWERKAEAQRAVVAERDALTAMIELTAAAAPRGGSLHQAVVDYVEAVVTDEWPRMEDQQSSADADERLNRLLYVVASEPPRLGVAPVVHEALLQKALRAREARGDRLSLSDDRVERLKWLSVLLLALMTQIALCAVHLDRAAPQRLALAIFTVAGVIAICVVAAYERPFDGPIRIPPDPLAEILISHAD